MTPDELKLAILKNAARELAKYMGPAGEPPMERHPDCVLECQQAVDYGVDNQYSCSPRCARLAGIAPRHHANCDTRDSHPGMNLSKPCNCYTDTCGGCLGETDEHAIHCGRRRATR